VWGAELSIRLGDAAIATDLRHWVNEGLMTFFFLVVGLEAKRELDVGQLRERRRLAALAVMSAVATASAVGIYIAFNAGGDGAHGWAAAMSTDTAFLLGVLALVAPNGTRLRVRLLTMAVVDDLVALVVIATVYTEHLSLIAGGAPSEAITHHRANDHTATRRSQLATPRDTRNGVPPRVRLCRTACPTGRKSPIDKPNLARIMTEGHRFESCLRHCAKAPAASGASCWF
jgi:hypothetical protein